MTEPARTPREVRLAAMAWSRDKIPLRGASLDHKALTIRCGAPCAALASACILPICGTLRSDCLPLEPGGIASGPSLITSALCQALHGVTKLVPAPSARRNTGSRASAPILSGRHRDFPCYNACQPDIPRCTPARFPPAHEADACAPDISCRFLYLIHVRRQAL